MMPVKDKGKGGQVKPSYCDVDLTSVEKKERVRKEHEAGRTSVGIAAVA